MRSGCARARLPMCLACALAAAMRCGASAEPRRPVLISDQRLATLRARLRARVQPTTDAYHKLKARADRDLDREPHVLEEWYVPGYYRDAKGHASAKRGLQDDANAVYRLALVYQMTGEAKYADAAVRLVDAWATRVKSTSKKDDSTLSFSYHFPSMIFGAALLRDAPQFTEEKQRAFEVFLREKALPLNTMDRRNNWGNWGLVLVFGVASYLDDRALFARAVERWRRLTDEQVAEDGHLPHEVKRNGGRSGIWYSHFSLMPHTIAAEVARVNGVDLYEYRSNRGRTMRMAFERLAPWTRRPETFPYYDGDAKNLHGVTYYSYFEILNAHWPNEDAAALLEQRRPMTASHSAPALTFTHGGLLLDGPRPARKKEEPRTRTVTPPPRRVTPSAAVVAEWDERLRALVRGRVDAGEKLRFYFGAMRQEVVAMDDDGTLQTSTRGITLRIEWRRLKPRDKKNLAVACAKGDALSEAIAGFYCLLAGDQRAGDEHLRGAGELGGAVRAAFGGPGEQ